MIEFAKGLGNTFRDISQPTGSELAKNPATAGVTKRAEKSIAKPLVIELIGDVGVGKTTFVRGFAKGLGVKEPITSPSFTISKSYAGANNITLTHYDFYRLQDPGLMADDLAESIAMPKNIVIVEWANSVDNFLPKDRTKITIKYNKDGTREVVEL